MGGIGYALGSILTGAGEGLAAQAEDNSKMAAADLASRREIALENLRNENQARQTEAKANFDDRNAARNDARDFAYGTQKTAQEHGNRVAEIKIKGTIDFSNDSKVAALEHRYKLAEGAADDARQLDHDLRLAGETVDHWEVTTDGRLVALTKTGQRLSQSSVPGTYVPSRTSVSQSGDEEGGTIADAVAARGGGAAKPQARTRPTGNVDDSVLSQLARMPPPPDGKVGRTMSGPNGMRATWNGKTWVLGDRSGE